MKFIKYLPLVLLFSINMQAADSGMSAVSGSAADASTAGAAHSCGVKSFLQEHRTQLVTGALLVGTGVLKPYVPIPEGIAQTVTHCAQGAVSYHYINSIRGKNQDLNVRGLAKDVASIGVASVADRYLVQGVELLPEQIRRYVKFAIGGQEGGRALVRRGLLFYAIRNLAERADKATFGK